MFNRKFLSIILSVLFLTACSGSNDIQQTSVSETTTTVATSAETTTASVVTEAVTTTEITEEEVVEKTTVTSPGKLTPEEYFSTHGYTYESYKELYIDMTNFSDGEVPLSELDNEYLDDIRYLTIQNASNADLNFVSNCPGIRTVTIENYSGNSDLSVLNDVLADKIIFRNSNEADITSLTKCQNIEGVTFDGYNGKMNLSFIADCDSVVGLTFDNIIDSTGLDVVSECENITSLYIDSYNETTDLGFLSNCHNLNYLRLFNHKIDADKLSEILMQTNLTRIYIATDNYDPADGEKLIKALPECEICYCLDDSPWMEGYPEEGFNFYVPPSIVASSLEDDWVCRDSEVGFDYPNSEWSYFKGLICVFSNCTDKVQTAETAQLFRIYDGETPILFKNGTDTLEVNFEVQPRHKTDFLITHDMLDYSVLEAGIYKIVFTCGKEKLEQQFSVYENSSPIFLTEEQLEIFNDEHENTYRQMVYNDRGFDISHFDDSFLPVYSSDDEVVFQNIVTHAHEDNPYFVWFETLNYRMIKTDDGWKFDIFQFWY